MTITVTISNTGCNSTDTLEVTESYANQDTVTTLAHNECKSFTVWAGKLIAIKEIKVATT